MARDLPSELMAWDGLGRGLFLAHLVFPPLLPLLITLLLSAGPPLLPFLFFHPPHLPRLAIPLPRGVQPRNYPQQSRSTFHTYPNSSLKPLPKDLLRHFYLPLIGKPFPITSEPTRPQPQYQKTTSPLLDTKHPRSSLARYGR